MPPRSTPPDVLFNFKVLKFLLRSIVDVDGKSQQQSTKDFLSIYVEARISDSINMLQGNIPLIFDSNSILKATMRLR